MFLGCSYDISSPAAYDIPAGTYTEENLYDLINGFVAKGATRGTISFTCYNTVSVQYKSRNVTSLGLSLASSAGTAQYCLTLGGEYTNDGTNWVTQAQSLTATNTYNSGTLHRRVSLSITGASYTVSEIKFL